MNNAEDPTKMSDEISSDPGPADVTIEAHEPRQSGPETLEIVDYNPSSSSEGSKPAAPAIEHTVAFESSVVPPATAETLVLPPEATQVGPDITANMGTESTFDGPAGMLTTDMSAPGREIYAGETLDTNEAHRTTEFVDRSGPGPGRSSSGRQAGMRTGPILPGYTLIAEIGRGGMGVVYKAWHDRLNRPVALKMILAGAHASSDQLERFQIEAQAVAQIQDSGIVQIYDVGEHEGLPYFSLEFVAGGSLDKQIGGKPQPPRAAASMVRKLALAMNQAHLRKIIHRDLKPANVLLTPEGEPKITDFGLAKRLEDDSHQTRSGAIMGTPSYMSPEQAWGQNKEIGTHTDQYALGTILYEMMVGHVPFQGGTALETLELARTQEPVPPTRLQPKIPVDLETICLKCLQKEPSKRYADVGILAEELGRFLDGRPILARPIGKTERTIRWCRRNPKIAGLVATVAVLIFAATTGSIAFAVVLNVLNENLVASNRAESAAKKEAQEKEAQATAAKIKEEEARIKAEKALKEFQTIAGVAFTQNRAVLETQRTMSVLLNQRLRQFVGAQGVREELIGVAMDGIKSYVGVMKTLTGILEDRDGELKSKRTLAGISLSAGRLMEEYERYDEASRYFEEVDKIAESLVANFPGEVEPYKVLAVSKGTLGGFQLDRLGNGKAALEFFRKTLEIRREILRRLPNDEESKRGVCNALGAIARSYLKLGDPGKAREIYREEVQVRDHFSAAFAAILVIRSERAGLEEKLGDVCLDLNDFDGARTYYNSSLKLRKEISEDHPDETQAKRDVILSIRKIATLDLFELKPKAALDGYLLALEDFKRRLKAEPNNLLVKQDVAITEYYVATASLRLKQFEAAREHYRACLDVRLSLADDPTLKLNKMDVMIARARCGQHEAASKTARELCEKPPFDSRVYFQAACGFSLCAGSLADLPASAENDSLARQYIDQALKALRLARKAGWKNLGDLRNDPDLDPIRNNPGFAAVLKEFQEESAP